MNPAHRKNTQYPPIHNECENPTLLFLSPLREKSAVSIGNKNIISSLSHAFRVKAFHKRPFDVPKQDNLTLITLSSLPVLGHLQALYRGLTTRTDLLVGNCSISEVPVTFMRAAAYVPFLHTCYERFGKHKTGSPYQRLWHWSYKHLLRKADAVIAISDFVKQGFVREFGLDPNKVHVILNSVDTTFFHPKQRSIHWLRTTFGIKNERKNILYLGKLTETKRGHLVPQIAALLPQYNFIIQGSNDLALTLDAPNIYFRDSRPPRDTIPRIFASSDLFLFPSREEPCAAVVSEAMASGLPLVATQAGSVPEQMEGNGHLIPISDNEIEEFARKITDILENPATWKKFSEASRARALQLDKTIQGKKYDEVFLKVLPTHLNQCIYI